MRLVLKPFLVYRYFEDVSCAFEPVEWPMFTFLCKLRDAQAARFSRILVLSRGLRSCNFFVATRLRQRVTNRMQKVCSFGPAGERPQYCSAHRRGGMVDVKSKVCAERGCDKRSSFGEAGMPPRFCAKHRPHGMVDVVHRRCETPLCQRHPTYGYRGQRRRFCAHHMVREIKGRKVGCCYIICNAFFTAIPVWGRTAVAQ